MQIQRRTIDRAPRSLAILGLAAALSSAAGCGGGGSGHYHDDGVLFESLAFAVTVPAGSPSQGTFDDETTRIPGEPSDIDLAAVTITSPQDLSFITRIEVEAKDYAFFQGRYRTIARFEGPLAPGTRSIRLGLRETHLDAFEQPFGDRMEVKVRWFGEAPPEDVTLHGSIQVHLRYPVD